MTTAITPFPRNVRPVEPRVPPHNFEAEQALLGALLVNNETLHKVADFLLPKHFADPLHGRIYEACKALIERHVVANPVMLLGYFSDADFPAEGSAASYLARLAGAAIGLVDAADYGRRIVELYERRQLADIGQTIMDSAYEDNDKPGRELIADAEALLCAVAEQGHASDRLMDSRASVDSALERVEQAIQDQELPEAERNARRIITGLPGLDDKLRIERGDLVFIAGATSMGKSALADGIAEANEVNGVGVGIFAMEMTSSQWAMRRLARHTGISSRRIAAGDVSRDELARIVAMGRKLQSRPHWIDDTPGLSVGQIRSRVRRLKRQHGIGVAIVDYLQLMQPDAGGRQSGTRAEEIGRMTRALKVIPQELDIALIVLSQVNRGIDGRDEKRPTLGDLRESGSIEQDANAVVFVYREEYYLSRGKPIGKGGKPPSIQDEADQMARLEQSRGKAEIIVAKQREGEAPATIHCRWDGIRTRFHDGGPA